MIRFACPHCRSEYTLADDWAGRVATCPGCRKGIQVPSSPPSMPPLPIPRDAANPEWLLYLPLGLSLACVVTFLWGIGIYLADPFPGLFIGGMVCYALSLAFGTAALCLGVWYRRIVAITLSAVVLVLVFAGLMVG